MDYYDNKIDVTRRDEYTRLQLIDDDLRVSIIITASGNSELEEEPLEIEMTSIEQASLEQLRVVQRMIEMAIEEAESMESEYDS